MTLRNVFSLCIGTCVAVLVVWPSTGAGQIVRTQDGRLLDRNPQIGSGGQNTVQGGSGGVSSQLYETGTLRGRTAQLQFGRLRDRNPQIGSGGYNVVLGGDRGVNTQLFLNRSRSALGLFRGDVPYTSLRTIQRGGPNVVSATGINQAINTNIIDQRVIRKIYSQYQPLPEMKYGQRLSDVVAIVPRIGGLQTPAEAGTQEPEPALGAAPGPVDLFASGASTERQKLAAELGQLRRDLKIDLRVPTRVPQVRPAEEEKEKQSEDDAQRADKLQAAANRLDLGLDETPQPSEGDASATAAEIPTVQPGQQTFVDLLVAIKHLRDSPLQRIKAEDAARAEEAAKAAATQPARDSGVLRTGEQIVVRGLSGSLESRFNQYTAKGYELLGERRFYPAVDAYDLAVTVQPQDPMGHMGLGVALLAAGETVTAAREFRNVLQMLPAIMENDVRFDIKQLFHPGNEDVLEKRRSAVNQQIVGNEYPDRMQVFLATFLHYNLNRPVDAKYFATILARVAGDDQVLSRYAKFVLSKTK